MRGRSSEDPVDLGQSIPRMGQLGPNHCWTLLIRGILIRFEHWGNLYQGHIPTWGHPSSFSRNSFMDLNRLGQNELQQGKILPLLLASQASSVIHQQLLSSKQISGDHSSTTLYHPLTRSHVAKHFLVLTISLPTTGALAENIQIISMYLSWHLIQNHVMHIISFIQHIPITSTPKSKHI